MNPLFLFLLKMGASVVLRSAVKFSKTKIDDEILSIYDLLVGLLKTFKSGKDVDFDSVRADLIHHVAEIQRQWEIEKARKEAKQALKKSS